jgi:hypothetical protein
MKKRNTILILLGMLLIGILGGIFFGLYLMAIEDNHGDNQDIFFNSESGDIIVNNDSKEVGRILKLEMGFILVNNKEPVNTNAWWDDKNIEILRPLDDSRFFKELNYDDILELKTKGKIKLIKKLR